MPRLLRLPFVLLLSLLPGGCMPSGGIKITPVPSDLSLRESVVRRESIWTGNRILILDLSGVLLNNQELSFLSEGEHPVSLFVEKLNKAAADEDVKAVILRLNSPGGSVTASDAIYEEVRAFKKKTGKPVIAYFQDVAASGAYYVACASDEIIAQRTSVTGSIGVVMQMMDVSGTMSKIGITADAIKSGAFKDAGSPLRQMKPDERAVFQGLVDDFYRQFCDVVVSGRPKLTRESVTKLADGRVYSAQQALQNGLIDRIATLEETIDVAKQRAGVTVANTVIYHRPLVWTPNIYARSPQPAAGGPGSVNINLLNLNLAGLFTNQPRFMYIWQVEG